MRKRLIAVSAATLVGLATVSGAAFAATSSSATDPQQTLVDKIATKFNLDKNEVQKVFDENRQERHAQRQADVNAKIDQAVKDGKISQSLADQLKTKLKDLDTYRDSLTGKTMQERREAMKTKMDEFKKWVEENKINLRDLGLGRGTMNGKHMDGQHGHHMDNGNDSNDAQSS